MTDPAEVAPAVERWLTGPGADPSVRFRYWTEVRGRRPTDPTARRAKAAIGREGWARWLLDLQLPDGRWGPLEATARGLYVPKFVATNWIAIVLADLGMTRRHPGIRKAAELLLDRWGAKGGELSGSAGEVCVTGNAVRTLVRFGYLDHPAVQRSLAWLVRDQKADGGWHCFPSRHGTLDGWEALAAFAEIPEPRRSPEIRRSIERGAEFYLRRGLVREGTAPYAPWRRIHYPNHYYYDLLVGLRTLTRLGFGGDGRMAPALRWLRDRGSPEGRWALDAIHPDLDPSTAGYAYRNPVFPLALELPGAPSRWATVEALSVLARAAAAGG